MMKKTHDYFFSNCIVDKRDSKNIFPWLDNANEVSETGSTTAENLEWPMAGKQLADLVTALSNGETYVNIHTNQNPNGEMRGQITSSQQ